MFPAASNAIELPPIPVAEKLTLLAAASNSIRNQWPLLSATRYAPGVVANPLPTAIPLTSTCPCAVSATPNARDGTEPPMRTENTTAPSGFSLVRNDRTYPTLAGAVPPSPSPTTGKFELLVQPAMYALPDPSTAIDDTWSLAALSRYVRYRYPLAFGSSFTTATPMVPALPQISTLPCASVTIAAGVKPSLK